MPDHEATNEEHPALIGLPAHPDLRRASDLAPLPDALPTGLPPFDALFGGLALRRTHHLTGMRGGGHNTFLHMLLAATTQTAPAILFDPGARFHPAAGAAAGVHLPHLLWVRATQAERIANALAYTLRVDACPLIVWDAGRVPSPSLLDRLRTLTHRSAAALLLVTDDGQPPAGAIDGVTVRVMPEAWSHGERGRPGCWGRTCTLYVTDHQRGQAHTFTYAVAFPQPLPPLLTLAGKGGGKDARAANRGDLGSGPFSAMRRTG
jgi:hypothetical protein